jgi:hypothetical protein
LNKSIKSHHSAFGTSDETMDHLKSKITSKIIRSVPSESPFDTWFTELKTQQDRTKDLTVYEIMDRFKKLNRSRKKANIENRVKENEKQSSLKSSTAEPLPKRTKIHHRKNSQKGNNKSTQMINQPKSHKMKNKEGKYWCPACEKWVVHGPDKCKGKKWKPVDDRRTESNQNYLPLQMKLN